MAKLVSSTYGDSLFEAAVELNKVDALYDEAEAVLRAFNDNEELAGFLSHPKIDKEEKIKVAENIFERFISREMLGLLVTVIIKDRARDIEDILKYFIDKVKEYKGIGVAYVTTPKALSDAMKSKVLKKLLETTSYKEFEIKYSVDESLIGGMIIRIGDRIVDSSIKTKLMGISRELNKIDI